MKKEELKQQILEEFGDQLKLQDLDIELIEIVEQEKPPTDSELLEQQSLLDYLGQLGGRFVWVVKSVSKGVKRAAYVVMVYVTIMNLPDAIQKNKMHFPKSYEIAVDMGVKIKNFTFYDLEEDDIRTRQGQNEPDGFVIFKSHWIGNPVSYEEDKSRFSEGAFGALITSATSSLAVSGSSATTSASVMSYSSSDATLT